MSRNKVNNVLSAFDDAIADIIDEPTDDNDDDDEDIEELTSLRGKRPLQSIIDNVSHSGNPAKRRIINSNKSLLLTIIYLIVFFPRPVLTFYATWPASGTDL